MKQFNSLQKLGLGEKEQAVYLSLLQLEKATANQVAYKSGIKRPTTYDILYRLRHDGFVAETEENGKRLFVATPPDKLKDVIENQKRELEADLPQLLSIFNTKAKRPKVAYFEGFEGIKQLYDDTLETVEAGDEILAYVTDDTITSLTNYARDYVKRRVEKGVKLRGVYQDTPGMQEYLCNNSEQLRESRVIDPTRYLIKNEINIYANKMIIITYNPEPFGILIESKEVVDTQKTIFELAWQAAGNIASDGDVLI